MGMMINRRRVCGGKKGLLPSGYKQLEYIENRSNAYINTGWYLPSSNDTFHLLIEAQGVGYQNLWAVFCGVNLGQSGETQYYLIQFYSNTNNAVTFHNSDVNATVANNIPIVANSRNVYEMSYDGTTTKAYINGDLVGQSNKSISNITSRQMFIFGSNTPAGVNQYSRIKLSRFELKQNDIMVLNLIPCVNLNNVVGLYDTVGQQFYSSPNGSAFIAGTDV